MKKYKIGFISTLLVTGLQKTLLDEGHELYVWWHTKSEKDTIDAANFNRHYPNFHIVAGKKVTELKSCDFIFCDTNHLYGTTAEELRSFHNYVIVGDKRATVLETNREFGKYVARNIGLHTVEDTHYFYNSQDAIKWLELKPKNSQYVLKGEDDTYISNSIEEAIAILNQDKKNFSNKNGFLIEKKIIGQEASMGRWFNGDDYLPFYLSTREYKGANNDDRGNILTGEIATGLIAFDENNISVVWHKIFDNLKPYLKNIKYKGFVDINTIVRKNKINFLEFTIRPGYPTELEIASYLKNKYGEFLATVSGYKNTKFELNFIGLANSWFAHGLGLSNNNKLKIKPEFSISKKIEKHFIPFDIALTDNINKWKLIMWDRLFFLTVFDHNVYGPCFTSLKHKLHKLMSSFNIWGHTYRDDIGYDMFNVLTMWKYTNFRPVIYGKKCITKKFTNKDLKTYKNQINFIQNINLEDKKIKNSIFLHNFGHFIKDDLIAITDIDVSSKKIIQTTILPQYKYSIIINIKRMLNLIKPKGV